MDEKKYNSYAPERLTDFESDTDYIMDKLQNDEVFCQHFFFDTDVKKCNIARLRRKILNELRDVYHVVIEEYEFNTIVYETLIGNKCDWAPLNTYVKKCTFFAWLRKVARNAVFKRLEKEHAIPEFRYRTVGNTRLTMLSQSRETCEDVLDEMMTDSEYYPLLHAIYVTRKPTTDILKDFNLSAEDFAKKKRKAETALKDKLLRSLCYYEEDVLHDKSSKVIHVSSEFVADIAGWYKSKSDFDPLSDVLGANLNDAEIKERIVSFLYDFSETLDWKEEDRYVWRKRFLENTSPVYLAEQLNRTRGWVDTRYSRLNERFNTAIREWWKKNT